MNATYDYLSRLPINRWPRQPGQAFLARLSSDVHQHWLDNIPDLLDTSYVLLRTRRLRCPQALFSLFLDLDPLLADTGQCQPFRTLHDLITPHVPSTSEGS